MACEQVGLRGQGYGVSVATPSGPGGSLLRVGAISRVARAWGKQSPGSPDLFSSGFSCRTL